MYSEVSRCNGEGLRKHRKSIVSGAESWPDCLGSVFPLTRNTSYIAPLKAVPLTMPPALAAILQRIRSLPLSIGRLTFGSFLLLLAVITATSVASVIAIRHIGSTVAELQRLQDVGDLAEQIDRRMNELRLAARDFVVDPADHSDRVGQAVSELSALLKKTRLELAPEQQKMLDGVTERLSTYRSGIERISALISRRAELIAGLPALRAQFDQAVADDSDPVLASTLSQTQSRIATALLAHDPSAAEQAAESMRTLTDATWQSIVLGTIGVLIGIMAALVVVSLTVRPLAAIASSIRALAAGEKDASIPSTDVNSEIGDIARAAEVFRRTLVDADAAREAAVHALAEQRLAEESYRKLFEASIDGIYVTTPAGALLNANPALARIMGYDTPEALINDISDVASTVYVHPAAREQYQFLMQRDGMEREFESQVRRRDGRSLWLSDSAAVVRDERGEVIRYEGTVRDITDQKRAEDAIAEGRRMLQMVIDTVPAVINVKNRDLRYVLMNRYMAGIFGIEPSDAIGHTTSDLMSRYGAQKTDENDKRVLKARRGLGFY